MSLPLVCATVDGKVVKSVAMDTKAKKNNMLTIAARTPTYEEGDSTWWLQSNKTNAYLQAPINQVAYSGYNIDKTKILFSGYSCCTEFLSYYVSAYSSTFCGGGAMISGGGGASSSAPGTSRCRPLLI